VILSFTSTDLILAGPVLLGTKMKDLFRRHQRDSH